MHPVEEQQGDEDDETNAGDDHPAQQEAVAALRLHDLSVVAGTWKRSNDGT